MGKAAHTPHNGDMSAASTRPWAAVAVLLFAPSIEAQAPQLTLAPSYSTATIANTATSLNSGFAPNSMMTIYGTNLSFSDAAGTSTNQLPTGINGVSVYLGSTAAGLFYVSPQQINVLIPYSFTGGPITVRVVREGTAGPSVPIELTAAAPGLFQSAPNTLVATHADNSMISASSPASAGEVIVIFATGLGATTPDQADGFVPVHPARLSNMASLTVLLNGVPLAPAYIQYAGISPGCAGLYQINLQLPTPLPANPEIRIAVETNMSQPSMYLPTR
jgi:uncharacterized protein (TIGR03437 family)